MTVQQIPRIIFPVLEIIIDTPSEHPDSKSSQHDGDDSQAS